MCLRLRRHATHAGTAATTSCFLQLLGVARLDHDVSSAVEPPQRGVAGRIMLRPEPAQEHRVPGHVAVVALQAPFKPLEPELDWVVICSSGAEACEKASVGVRRESMPGPRGKAGVQGAEQCAHMYLDRTAAKSTPTPQSTGPAPGTHHCDEFWRCRAP